MTPAGLKQLIRETLRETWLGNDGQPKFKSTVYPKGHPELVKQQKAKQDAEDKVLQAKLKADYQKEHPAQKYRDMAAQKAATKTVKPAPVKRKATPQYNDDSSLDGLNSQQLLSRMAYRANMGTDEFIRRHGVPRPVADFDNKLSRAAYRAGLSTDEYIRRHGGRV